MGAGRVGLGRVGRVVQVGARLSCGRAEGAATDQPHRRSVFSRRDRPDHLRPPALPAHLPCSASKRGGEYVASVLLLVGLVLVSTVVSAQPAPPPVIIEMPAGVPGVAMPQMPPRDNAQPAKPGKATLRGHVVAADTGQPLRKAQVRIFASELRENRMTTTDADGRYEFKELPAGRYNVSASKGSYVQLQYGQQRPFEPGKPLEILDGADGREGRLRAAPRRRDHRAASSTSSASRSPMRRWRRSATRTWADGAGWCRPDGRR